MTGSDTGAHPGRWVNDSDGKGASFFPDKPFAAGETVRVHTGLHVAGVDGGEYTFSVSRPVHEVVSPRAEPNDPSQTMTFPADPELRVPKVTTMVSEQGVAAGDLFLAPKAGPGQDGPMILDASGRLVWFHPLPRQMSAFDFRTQNYAGHPVLTWWQGYVTRAGHGQGEDVIYDDTYQPVATVHAGNGYDADLHEFQLSGHNTALITVYQLVTWNLSSVGDPTDGTVIDSIVQEIDVPTGNVLFEWHSLDHVPLSDSYADAPTILAPSTFDYFHVNSVDEAADGSLLVSGRGTHAVYKIDHATGAVDWTLGGKRSDFALGPGVAFHSQHDAKWVTPRQISLFDNGAGVGGDTEPRSRALVIDLDLTGHRATLAAADSLPGHVLATSQGDTQLEPNGNLFVGWGDEPYMSEFSPTGTLLLEMRMAGHSYRAYRLPWSGHPVTRPALALSANAGTIAADVSWNGATDVARWRLLGGPDKDHLDELTSAPATGFDTRLTVGTHPSYLAVEALDHTGHVLARSSVVQAPHG